MISIANNLVAMNANRQYNIVGNSKAKSTEKLSSGYKINRAADDSAGLSISEKMRRQIRGLTQASANVEEGVGYVQTADGALNEAHEITQRMNELAVKAANGTLNDTDRSYINQEVQQLKEELDRIFTTTSFNDRLIWNPEGDDQRKVGEVLRTAVETKPGDKSEELTSKNIGMVPTSDYYAIKDEKPAGRFTQNAINLSATDAGISFMWKGYNGYKYQTSTISWEDLKAKGYSFTLSELYPKKDAVDADTYSKFYDTSVSPAVPRFDQKVSFSVNKAATVNDLKNSLDNTWISVGADITLSGNFTSPAVSNKVSLSNQNINLAKAYQSSVSTAKTLASEGAVNPLSFDAGVNPVLVPSPDAKNLTSYPTNNADTATKIEFSFKMAGIADSSDPTDVVKGSLSSVTYTPDGSIVNYPAAEGKWWDWYKDANGNKVSKYLISRSITAENLADITKAIEGSGSKLGIKDLYQYGCGGQFSMNFTLKDSTNPATGNNVVGNFGFTSIRVLPNESVSGVLDKVRANFNSNTKLSFYTTNDDVNKVSKPYTYPTRGLHIYNPEARNIEIINDVMAATNGFHVQANSEAHSWIKIQYDGLNRFTLGLGDTNVLTQENAGDAINEIKGALEIISKQRSDFGAYQNRLEHTVKNLDNVTENTTAAESQIRDTDMAKEMVSLSLSNILSQAGESMLAQANQSNQGVLSLLS